MKLRIPKKDFSIEDQSVDSSEESSLSSGGSGNSSFDHHRKKFRKLLGKMDDLQAFKNGVIKQHSVELSEESNPNLSDTERSVLDSIRNQKVRSSMVKQNRNHRENSKQASRDSKRVTFEQGNSQRDHLSSNREGSLG